MSDTGSLREFLSDHALDHLVPDHLVPARWEITRAKARELSLALAAELRHTEPRAYPERLAERALQVLNIEVEDQ